MDYTIGPENVKSLIYADLYRYTGKKSRSSLWGQLWSNKVFRHQYWFRKVQGSTGLKKVWNRLWLHTAGKQSGVELPHSITLGAGALFLHPTGITINSQAVIGKNLTMLKGATIGNCKRGKLAGAPAIGDDVYIGLHATIVGNIKIGNDVMICANTFVNFDVPDHSVVLGCPGVIHPKEAATEGYLVNQI